MTRLFSLRKIFTLGALSMALARYSPCAALWMASKASLLNLALLVMGKAPASYPDRAQAAGDAEIGRSTKSFPLDHWACASRLS